MTKVFCDKDFNTESTSSVIDHVYYSTDEKKLFVELVSGVLAGYENVPVDIYTAMETINQNRVSGADSNASVGRYWNQWIKPYLNGIDTYGVEIETQGDRDRTEKLRALVQQTKDVFAPAKSVEVDADVLTPFGVTFVSSTGEDVTLSVAATDYKDAIDRFTRAIDILGWEESPVKSVTMYLN